MCIGILLAYLSVHHVYVQSAEAEEGAGSPGTGVADGCEPICGCCKLDPGLLEKQSVL